METTELQALDYFYGYLLFKLKKMHTDSCSTCETLSSQLTCETPYLTSEDYAKNYQAKHKIRSQYVHVKTPDSIAQASSLECVVWDCHVRKGIKINMESRFTKGK